MLSPRQIALAKGARKYRSGRDCPNGHENPLRNVVNGACRECLQARYRAWYGPAREPPTEAELEARKERKRQQARENYHKLKARDPKLLEKKRAYAREVARVARLLDEAAAIIEANTKAQSNDSSNSDVKS